MEKLLFLCWLNCKRLQQNNTSYSGNGDSINIIMYAENLGSIPPNTGLLVLHDGEKVYEIRFTGDLQKNSAIILRRKKKDF